MKKFYVVVVSFLILAGLFVVSCNKESSISENQFSDTKEEEKADLLRIESTIFSHLSLFGSTPAEAYLAEPSRKVFKEKMDKYSPLYRKNSFSKNIDVAIENKLLSPESKGEWLKIEKFIKDLPSKRTNFLDCSTELDRLVNEFENSSLKGKDKSALKQFSSILKGLSHYGFEYEKKLGVKNGLNTRNACGFWDKFWCWGGNIFGGFLVGALVGCSIDGTYEACKGLDGVWGPIGAVAGAIAGFIYSIDDCECIVCDSPDGISLTEVECNGNAKLIVWGSGEDANFFSWFNIGGTPTTAVTASTYEGASELRVSQSGSNPIFTSVGPVGNNICDGAQRLPGTFDIKAIARDPGSLFLSSNGENQNNIKRGTELLYFIGGSAVASGRTTFRVIWGNTIGWATFLGNNWFKVYFWNTGTGTMTVEGTNTCSGQTVLSSSLQVTVVN